MEAVPENELLPIKIVKNPLQPSQAEINEHEALGHVNYRSWRPVCVATKSFGQQHVAAPEEDETAVPHVV